jgi:2-isopropylmalate synthase
MTEMATKRQRIEIYDTTLRDGTQGLGVSLSVQDKLLIAQRLDELGIDYIEGGYPLSNPKDEAFFVEAARMRFKHAKLAAFGMTRRRNVKAAGDEGLESLLRAGTDVVTIVGKSWDMHVREVLGVTEKENLTMIADSVAHCAAAGRIVIFDAEHFFDGYAANPGHALATLLAAQEAGAACVCLCDTNGGTLPERVAERIEAVRPRLSVRIGIHTHNDAGLAVANSLAAVCHGATQVQGTINGIGERCGNVDLTTVVANLALKYGYEVLADGALSKLTETSRYVYELANMIPAENQPFVGSGAFAHKGGMHVHAVRRVARSYEHVQPESVGNTRRLLISELSGVSGLAAKVGRKLDVEHDKKLQRRLLQRIKQLENEGYVYESAEASFELACRKELGLHRKFWDLGHWRSVILKTAEEHEPDTEVILKLKVNGDVQHQVADGHGPVDAMATAMTKALRDRYPNVQQIRLIDYKVRVINPRAATAAKVRVTIEFLDEATHEVYGTVGVSENILEASWEALTDGIEYKLLSDEDRAGPRGGA